MPDVFYYQYEQKTHKTLTLKKFIASPILNGFPFYFFFFFTNYFLVYINSIGFLDYHRKLLQMQPKMFLTWCLSPVFSSSMIPELLSCQASTQMGVSWLKRKTAPPLLARPMCTAKTLTMTSSVGLSSNLTSHFTNMSVLASIPLLSLHRMADHL